MGTVSSLVNVMISGHVHVPFGSPSTQRLARVILVISTISIVVWYHKIQGQRVCSTNPKKHRCVMM